MKEACIYILGSSCKGVFRFRWSRSQKEVSRIEGLVFDVQEEREIEIHLIDLVEVSSADFEHRVVSQSRIQFSEFTR